MSAPVRTLYLPVLGPNDPRDFAGFGVDIAMDPFTWVGQGVAVQVLGYSKWALNALDQRSRLLGDIDNIKKTALDPYATFRSLYRQHRQSQIEEMENDNRATVPDWYPQPARPTKQTTRPPMPSRRLLLTVSGAWLALGGAARAQSATDRASAFVKATGEKLVGVVNGPGASAQKRQMLTQIIDSTVDVDGVAKFCLGRSGSKPRRSNSSTTSQSSTRCWSPTSRPNSANTKA